MDYELAKELALVSAQIQDAYRELEDIKAQKGDFIEERTREVDERIRKALTDSKSLVTEANSYADDVRRLITIASELFSDLKARKVAFMEERRLYGDQVANLRDDIDEEIKSLGHMQGDIRKRKSELNGQIDEVTNLREMLRKEQLKVDDDRNKLAGALKVWRKQQETKTE